MYDLRAVYEHAFFRQERGHPADAPSGQFGGHH